MSEKLATTEKYDAKTQERIDNISRIREYFNLTNENLNLGRLPELAPTLGIEIEISWSQKKFPGFKEKWLMGEKPSQFAPDKLKAFSKECEDLEKDSKPPYIMVEKLGIPKGRDGFWEFAHKPTKHPEILAAEVNGLFEAGLLYELDEAPDYSLHLTMGGISFNQNSYLIALILEINDGTSSERIQSELKKKAWSRLGSTGVKERRPEELEHDNTGFEIRTLILKNPYQLERILNIASYCGSLVNFANDFPDSPESKKWQAITRTVCETLGQYGIDCSVRWPEPSADPEFWAKYADFLSSSERISLINHMWYAI